MYGNWRFNLVTGLVGFVLVFLIALTSNPIFIALLRGVYSFIAFFVIAFGLRFLLGTLIFPTVKVAATEDSETEETSGQNIDYMATHEDENLNDLLKQQLTKNVASTKKSSIETANESTREEESFKPLKPTQLFSNKSVQPEEMSKAIRHLTGE